MGWRGLAWSVLLIGCAPEAEPLPPLGEALIVVDTTAPVPRLAARLRIDVYGEDGTWLDSRDLPMRRRADWPGSFSLYIDEATTERTAFVRLRAYADGKKRDYRGERFVPRPTPGDPAAFVEAPTGDDQPRLLRDGQDVTPKTEPIPGLAIDRLVRVHLQFGTRGRAQVMLDTVCAGTMADVAGRRTCIDGDALFVDVTDAVLDTDMAIPTESIGEGELARTRPCAGEPRADTGVFDGEVCVPGGMLFLGSQELSGTVAGGEEPEQRALQVPGFASVPERIAIAPALFMNQHEVTVGRWRRAVDVDGFVPPDPSPVDNNGPLATTSVDTDPNELCTWSAAPLGREDYPLNCVSWANARAFCAFYGGDLPTEAQWEYAAAAADRPTETRFPWGTDLPSCEQAVVGRQDVVTTYAQSNECIHLGFGAQPIAASSADVTASGIVGMGGSMGEWMLDSFRSFRTHCWATQGIVDPACWEDAAAHRSFRGGDWRGQRIYTKAYVRTGAETDYLSYYIGIRCVRRP